MRSQRTRECAALVIGPGRRARKRVGLGARKAGNTRMKSVLGEAEGEGSYGHGKSCIAGSAMVSDRRSDWGEMGLLPVATASAP